MLRLYKSVSLSNFPVLKYSFVWVLFGKLNIARMAFLKHLNCCRRGPRRTKPGLDTVCDLYTGELKNFIAFLEHFVEEEVKFYIIFPQTLTFHLEYN